MKIDHEWPRQFLRQEDNFVARTTEIVNEKFANIQRYKKENQAGEIQKEIIDMLSVIVSSLEWEKVMIEKGVKLAGEGENLALNLSELYSTAMWIFFDYIDSLQVRQDTAILNESTIRQLDQILIENLPKVNMLDLDEEMEEYDLEGEL